MTSVSNLKIKVRRIEPSAAAVNITEDSAALCFSERYRGTLLYCHTQKIWYAWNGIYWRQEGTGLVFEQTRQLVRELTADQSVTVQQKCNKTGFVAGVEKFARSDRQFAVEATAWDADPFLLGTPAGTVDLRTGEVLPPNPGHRITRITGCEPTNSSDCPLWQDFLWEATGGDTELITFLQQWSGYCLTGVTQEHALVFVHGGGGNGKSVFMNTVAGILGTYSTTAAMNTFTASRGDQHPTELARLAGARMVTASETEKGHAWAEARIKSITGGDEIAARFMRQDFFQFKPQFKLVIIGNHKPVLHNVDDAARRRFNIVPFARKPETPDPYLEQKLKCEWPAILRWMIEGCLSWQQHGLLRPASVKATTEAYFSDQDLMGQWLAEHCDAEVGNQFKSDYVGALFESWVEFCDAAGEKSGTKKSFSEALSQRGFVAKRGTGGARMFAGLRLKKQGPGFDD